MAIKDNGHVKDGKRTVAGWSYLARCVVAGLTQERADTLGRMCFEAEAAGENCSVWHQSAKLFGRRCNCQPCNPERAKSPFRYHHVA